MLSRPSQAQTRSPCDQTPLTNETGVEAWSCRGPAGRPAGSRMAVVGCVATMLLKATTRTTILLMRKTKPRRNSSRFSIGCPEGLAASLRTPPPLLARPTCYYHRSLSLLSIRRACHPPLPTMPSSNHSFIASLLHLRAAQFCVFYF